MVYVSILFDIVVHCFQCVLCIRSYRIYRLSRRPRTAGLLPCPIPPRWVFPAPPRPPLGEFAPIPLPPGPPREFIPPPRADPPSFPRFPDAPPRPPRPRDPLGFFSSMLIS